MILGCLCIDELWISCLVMIVILLHIGVSFCDIPGWR